MKKHVIVVGAGLGGLSAALRLLVAGHHVTVFEKRVQLGGRAQGVVKEGYRFEGLPQPIFDPLVLRQLLALLGEGQEPQLNTLPCGPVRFFGAAAKTLDVSADELAMLAEIERHAPADKLGYLALLRSYEVLRRSYPAVAQNAVLNALDRAHVGWELWRTEGQVPHAELVAKHLQDPWLKEVFSAPGLFLGANPAKLPALLGCSYALVNEPQQIMGGMDVLIDLLARKVTALGGEVFLKAEAEHVVLADDALQVRGLRMVGGSLQVADAFVFNADVAYCHRVLLAPALQNAALAKAPPKAPTKAALAPQPYDFGAAEGLGLFALHVGSSRRYADAPVKSFNVLLAHTLFEHDSSGLLQGLFKTLPPIMLYLPSLLDDSAAPEGGEVISAWLYVPNLSGRVDYRVLTHALHSALLKMLEATFFPDLSAHIVVEKIHDPRHFEAEFYSTKGCYALFPPLQQGVRGYQSAAHTAALDNVYFVGASAHPGPGLRGVLSSAQIAENLIGSA